MDHRHRPEPTSNEDRLVRLLPRVEKPGRYIGGEWNEVRKDPSRVRLRVALAFPDVYEIGLSYLGQKILYHLINGRPGLAAERVFAPWPDMERELRRAGLPLLSLETKTPLALFDIVGFSLLYELNDSNILTMLDLGGIPLRTAERGEAGPIVLAGGPAAFNPEPLADIFDAFFVGDGEEAFLEIAETVLERKGRGSGRGDVLQALSRIAGVYVPSLYRPVRGRGRMIVPEPGPGAPARVRKRVLLSLPGDYPERIIVPHVQAVFDRVAMEVARGCPQRCRFCQATSLYFPHRPRPPADVIRSTLRSLEATGYEDASLSALSVGDYPCLNETVRALMGELAGQGISLSLSSLRPKGLSADVVESILKVRKTGFTLVPEAGTERLRKVINKDLRDEDIVAAAENAFGQGWRLLKLYFMIGLPTERQEDLDGIEATVRAVLDAGRRARGAPPRVHVSVSSFIPKPHTPFQWLAMEDPSVLAEKMRSLEGRLRRHRTVELKIHDLETSIVEAVFSRGDRRLGPVLVEAWKNGARFDSWRDFFDFGRWTRALEAGGLEAGEYLAALDPEAALPWEVIETGLSRDHLRRELDKALRGEMTPPCGETDCPDCLGCAPDLRARRAVSPDLGGETFRIEPLGAAAGSIVRYRASFAKTGPARFLSHNDLANTLRRAFRRAGVSVLRSAGFHPKMLVSYLPALPLGMEGRGECLDFKSDREMDPGEFLSRMNATLPRGVVFRSLERLAPGSPSLADSVERFTYSLDLEREEAAAAVEAEGKGRGLAPLAGRALLERLMRDAFPGPDGRAWTFAVEEGPARLRLDIAPPPSGAPRPQDIVAAVLPALEFPVFFMAREEVVLKPPGQIDKTP
jgi:radical SAM family uncharacterized protein